MNCGPPDQLPPVSAPSCFLNLNWDQSMAAATAGDHLDPALSSMVSSPASNSTAAAATDGRALHGISPQPQYGGTPLSSPPKLNLFHQTRPQFHHFPPPQVGCGAAPGGLPILENLMPTGHLDQFLADPGFAQRAARLSGFDGRPGGSGYGGGVAGQFGLPEAGPIGALKELELGNGRDESSVSDPASAGAEMALKGPSDGNAKKRKASAGKGKGKDGPGSAAAKEESSGKRCRSADESSGAEDNPASKGKAAQSSSENGGGKKQQGKDSAAKPPAEPPKDYIHVRARRGEATDSHSLAERVRREKISQRMKLLQDLVPGCNKVVGKAVMLDEIINYVQSLQRQVEFLSMKLATVNPQLDFNSLPNLLLPKDIHHQSTCGPAQFPLETSGAPLPYLGQPQPHHHGSPLGCMDSQSCMHPLDAAFCRPMNGPQHPFLNGASDAASQVGTFWQDDLQSVVHMDIGQSQEIAPTSSNSYNGSLQTVHMKMEL